MRIVSRYRRQYLDGLTRQGEEEQAESKQLGRKLVRLFHPDCYQDDPEKQAIYQPGLVARHCASPY